MVFDLIGKTINSIFGGPSGDEGSAPMRAAVKALEGVGIPTIEAQKIVLETPELVGEIVPEFEQFEQLMGSSLEDISIDPVYKEKALDALNTLSEISQEGLTEADEAELRQIRRAVAGEAQSRDARVIQNLAERGMAGSGVELATRLAGGQAAQQAQAEAADRAMQIAQANKLAALDKVGALSSQMRGQEFGEQAEIAKAKDLINQFNLAQRANVQQRNVDRTNQAQVANLAAKQAQADEATRLRNLQEQYNKQLIQQNFQNQVQKAGGVASGYQGLSGVESQQAANKQAGVGSMLSGLGTIGGAIIGGMYGGPVGAAAGSKIGGAVGGSLSDKNMKENIESGDADIEEMLDNLDAYEYDYKDETGIPGRHMGVMAQDLEKSEMGDEFVEDTEQGKMVDYGEAAPAMMAALANGNKRLRRLEKMFGLKEED